MADKWLKVIITVIFAAFAPWTIIMQIPYPHTEHKMTSFGHFWPVLGYLWDIFKPHILKGALLSSKICVGGTHFIIHIYYTSHIDTIWCPDLAADALDESETGSFKQKRVEDHPIFTSLKIKQGLYCQHPRDFYYTAENVKTPTRRLRYFGQWMSRMNVSLASDWLTLFSGRSDRLAFVQW